MVEERKGILTLRRKRLLGLILLAILVVGGAVGLYFYLQYKKTHISTDDAYVDGRVHVVASKISGTVAVLYVTDNQRVQKGAPLLAIDPVDYEVQLKGAQAALETEKTKLFQLQDTVQAARRQLLQGQAALGEAHSNLELQEANLRQAQKDLERAEFLMQKNLIARQDYDRAKTTYEVTLAQVKAAGDRIRQQEAAVETQKSLIRQAESAIPPQEATIRQRQASLKAAQLNVGYTVIRSPSEGYVTQRPVEVGNQIQPAQPLLSIVPLNPGNIWITANYKETQVRRMKPGQEVEIRVDSYPGRVFHGKVNSIMAGTGSVFSLFPPENATGNFVKVVQRIPVKIVLDPGEDPQHLLRIGMSVVPTILAK